MSLFKDILQSNETLFQNETALDYDYLPKEIKYRETQQHYIAECIKPLLQKRNGRNIIITGQPGIGKTAAIRSVLRDLENETDNIYQIYINCWKKDSFFKIITELCHQINYSWTHNKSGEDLIQVAANILNKKSVVIVLDEVDKLEDQSIIYSLLEDIHKKTIILITNDELFMADMDNRIRSRLIPDLLNFEPYNEEETTGILAQRKGYAFFPGVLNQESFYKICKKTFELQDIRAGLFLMKESGIIAEAKSSKKILEEHTNIAISKLSEFKIKKIQELNKESQQILDLIKQNSGKTVLEVFKEYEEIGGKKTYRTFSRKIKDLQKSKLINLKELNLGYEGRTTQIFFETKLDQFSND
ncbi:AAA family ATPase [Candidatus Woesearchaeota archaeon]|nr:AAA family ATPase [Candidatus Woesearchaeota archaeon]